MGPFIKTRSWWRRALPLAAGFLTVSLIGLLMVKKPAPRPSQGPLTLASPATAKPVSKKSKAAMIEEALKLEKLSAVEKFVVQESAMVGRPDPDPQRSYQRLKAVAHGLKRKDIETLKRTAIDTRLDNDRRFLSVYLLTLTENKAAAPALMSIALDPLAVQDVASRLYAEELMIRTQALQGLARYQPPRGKGPLQDYLSKQENAFLADQAQRLILERRRERR